MKKKTLANLVMVLIIVAIALAGILGVGYVKGWFDDPEGEAAVLTEIRGIVTLERSGIAYATTEDTVLRSGDKITCDAGATAVIRLSDGCLILGQSAAVTITEPAAQAPALEVLGGEVFANTVTPAVLHFDGRQIRIGDGAAATLSVRKGAQSISVYYGTVEQAQAGQILEWVGGEASVRDLSITTLNDFNIAQVRKANADKALVFTNAQLDQLEADRLAQAGQSDQSGSGDSDQPSSGTVTDDPTGESPTDTPSGSDKPDGSDKPKDEPKLSCTITIRCDTILNNWSDLEPSKAPYVPDSGCILPEVTVEFTAGETVFDVLNRVCSQYNIQIEYSWTPMYDSYYIEGINNLYEFDCGHESGWMYKVDGWFPNYGCSSYQLTGGESIVWCYTCKGYGTDVGGPAW